MPVTSGRSRQAGQGLAAFTSLLTGLLTPPAEHGLPPPLRNELAPLAQGGLPLATANPQQTARPVAAAEPALENLLADSAADNSAAAANLQQDQSTEHLNRVTSTVYDADRQRAGGETFLR